MRPFWPVPFPHLLAHSHNLRASTIAEVLEITTNSTRTVPPKHKHFHQPRQVEQAIINAPLHHHNIVSHHQRPQLGSTNYKQNNIPEQVGHTMYDSLKTLGLFGLELLSWYFHSTNMYISREKGKDEVTNSLIARPSRYVVWTLSKPTWPQNSNQRHTSSLATMLTLIRQIT